MLTSKQTYYLQTMGIEPWVMRRTESQALVMVVVDTPAFDANQNKLFYVMLRSVGLSEDDVSVVDGLQHLNKIKPHVVLALGHAAGQNVLNNSVTFDDMRKQAHSYENTPVIVTHHPSDLLEHPINKKEAYRDLGLVKAALACI